MSGPRYDLVPYVLEARQLPPEAASPASNDPPWDPADSFPWGKALFAAAVSIMGGVLFVATLGH